MTIQMFLGQNSKSKCYFPIAFRDKVVFTSNIYSTKLKSLFRAWHAELEKYRNDKMKDIDEKTSKAQKPSLRNVLIRTFGSSLIPLGIICFLEECVIR